MGAYKTVGEEHYILDEDWEDQHDLVKRFEELKLMVPEEYDGEFGELLKDLREIPICSPQFIKIETLITNIQYASDLYSWEDDYPKYQLLIEKIGKIGKLLFKIYGNTPKHCRQHNSGSDATQGSDRDN